MKVIHKDCDPSLAEDTSLPVNSYIITYIINDEIKYDIVQAVSFVSVFDSYYDELGKDSIKKINWTKGRVNSRVWGSKQTSPKKQKRR